mmetsp:Transcript_29164/g.72720  ORF Transcript_29164/g.72720 Transcript_29164/m.72720 type:complete len:106 (-) Transcript_29164:237-554(-)
MPQGYGHTFKPLKVWFTSFAPYASSLAFECIAENLSPERPSCSQPHRKGETDQAWDSSRAILQLRSDVIRQAILLKDAFPDDEFLEVQDSETDHGGPPVQPLGSF